MRNKPTADERDQILKHFLEGHGVNHVVYLMGFDTEGGYRFRTDDVHDVIRKALVRALGAHLTIGEQVRRAFERKEVS